MLDLRPAEIPFPASVGIASLPWQVAQLAQDFSDLIICPGYCSAFGSQSDEWGKVYIPGASSGYALARKRFESWKVRGSTDERYSWWPETMKSKGVEPVTVSSIEVVHGESIDVGLIHPLLSPFDLQAGDVLKGLPLARWKEYCKVYSRISKVRLVKRRRAEIKAAAIDRSQVIEREQEAAEVLTGLTA